MMHDVLLATDLDRTLIYSAAAAGPVPPDELVAVEHLDGRAISFMTPPGLAMLAALVDRCLLVPVTTRTPEQLARVRLPGTPARFAVAANGGVLLLDGVPDAGWSGRVRAALRDAAPLDEAFAALGEACRPAWSKPPRRAAELFCYGVVDRGALPAEALAGLVAWAGQAGWRVSLQGRKLYVVPRALTKSAAVAEIARRTGARSVLAAGDSLLDIDLLAAADRGVRPGHGEIHESGWSAPGVEVLASEGIRAGEDILAWFSARVDRFAHEDREPGRTPASTAAPSAATISPSR